MRLGVFGGTFDPPHLGHLLAAVDSLEQLSLDRILLIPNAVQPLKGNAQASPGQRLEMVQLLARGDSRFQVDSVEVDRRGPSYSVDTLEVIARREMGAQLFFLAGWDALEGFAKWKDLDRILALATLALVRRQSAAVGAAGDAARTEDIVLPPGAITVMTRTIDISSTEIRERVRLGKPIRGFVTAEVEAFISERGLYKQVTE